MLESAGISKGDLAITTLGEVRKQNGNLERVRAKHALRDLQQNLAV